MFDKKTLRRLLFVLMCFVLYKVVDNYKFFFSKITRFVEIMTPFFWAVGFAYILNPLMKFLQKKFKKLSKTLSLVIVYVIFFGLAVLISLYVIPAIYDSIVDLYYKLPKYPEKINNYIQQLPNRDSVFKALEKSGAYETLLKKGQVMLQNMLDLQKNNIINSVLFTAFSVTSGVVNFILGAFVSIYLLYDKDKLINGSKRIIRALFSQKTASGILDYLSKVNFYFYNFLIGKLIDSSIIGLMCYVGLLILKIKYPLLLSLLVGALNMIPYFGPVMGAVPVIFITLFYSPIKALWAGLFILGLQQFDGWYLGPKILGNTVGASPLFIIFSILIGGGFFGPLGMLLGVPVFKSLAILWEEFIDNRIQKDNVNPK